MDVKLRDFPLVAHGNGSRSKMRQKKLYNFDLWNDTDYSRSAVD